MKRLKKNKNTVQIVLVTLSMIVGMAMFSGIDEIILPHNNQTSMNIAGGKQIYQRINPSFKKIVEAHWQGMEVVPLTWEIAAKLNIPVNEKGVLVDEVTLFAGKSGLQASDVIKSMNGFIITNLDEFYKVTKRIKTQNQVSMKILRKSGKIKTINLIVPDELGFAQLESAPMILPGSIPPHRYRGPCIDCHEVGTTGELNPDPETITLTPPPISSRTKNPHRYRGKCALCHLIK